MKQFNFLFICCSAKPTCMYVDMHGSLAGSLDPANWHCLAVGLPRADSHAILSRSLFCSFPATFYLLRTGDMIQQSDFSPSF